MEVSRYKIVPRSVYNFDSGSEQSDDDVCPYVVVDTMDIREVQGSGEGVQLFYHPMVASVVDHSFGVPIVTDGDAMDAAFWRSYYDLIITDSSGNHIHTNGHKELPGYAKCMRWDGDPGSTDEEYSAEYLEGVSQTLLHRFVKIKKGDLVLNQQVVDNRNFIEKRIRRLPDPTVIGIVDSVAIKVVPEFRVLQVVIKMTSTVLEPDKYVYYDDIKVGISAEGPHVAAKKQLYQMHAVSIPL